jgi:hypothetical protein
LPAAGIAAAIERAMARCRDAQAISSADAAPQVAAQVSPQPIAAPAPVTPRIRVL